MKKNACVLLFAAVFAAGAPALRPAAAAPPDCAARVTVELEERELARMRGFARAVLPARGEDAALFDRLLVSDGQGRVFPVQAQVSAARAVAEVCFGVGAADRYYFHLGVPGAGEVSPVGDFPPEGTTLLGDFLPPDARTSGFWNWRAQPVLTGRFSHDGHGPGASYHGVRLEPRVGFRNDAKLIQYVFLDPQDPPGEIMIGLTTAGGRGAAAGGRVLFAWGQDLFRWREIAKRIQGDLPPPGRWVRLEVPLEGVGGNEISNLAFYYHGGRAHWGRSSLGDPAPRAVVREWRVPGKGVSAFFSADARGPFNAGAEAFYLLRLDASASAGARDFFWRVNDREYRGAAFTAAVAAGRDAEVSLSVEGTGGERDEREALVKAPAGQPRPLDVRLRITPYLPVARAGEAPMFSCRVANFDREALEVTLDFGGESRVFSLLPGWDNARVEHFTRRVSPGGGPVAIRASAGGVALAEEKLVFLTLSEAKRVTVQGPFLKEGDAYAVIVTLGPALAAGLETAPGETPTIAWLGDYPAGLPAALEEKLAGRGISAARLALATAGKGEGLDILEKLVSLLADLQTAPETDRAVFFPFYDTLLRGTPVELWERTMEAMLGLVAEKSARVTLVSPFPGAPRPGAFVPYRDALARLSERSGAPLLDLDGVYAGPDREAYFLRAPGVYQYLPGQAGAALLADRLAPFLFPALFSRNQP